MDWIMSNTRRFCEMAEEQQEFPFVLKPKILTSYKRIDVVKKCSRDSPKQVRVLRDDANILPDLLLSFTHNLYAVANVPVPGSEFKRLEYR